MAKGQRSGKKDMEISRFGKSEAHLQAEALLSEIKEKTGDVIQVIINDRTVIELPAHLSQAERDARVENYIKLHNIRIRV